MLSLAEIQMQFQNFVQGKSSSIEDGIEGKNAEEVRKRLAIYHEGYELRLRENLNKQFPVLAQALGYDAFNKLVKNFANAFPPSNYAIRLFGEQLPNYLLASEKYPAYLAELAAFEWAMNMELDFSEEQNLLTPEFLQQLTEENLLAATFQFQASLRMLPLEYDVTSWWQALRDKKKMSAPEKTTSSKIVIVWRNALQPYHATVNALEYSLIQAAIEGKNFTELCELASESLGEEAAAATVAQAVMGWLQNRWLTNEKK